MKHFISPGELIYKKLSENKALTTWMVPTFFNDQG
jgi:hypothetical protein